MGWRHIGIGAWALALLLAGCTLADAQAAKTGQQPTPPAVAPKAAPVSADPASTSATYGDWVLRCQRVGQADKTQRVCEVAQTIQVQGQPSPIAQLALGKIAASDPLRVTVALPNNISLPGSIVLGLSEKDPTPMPLTWRRCLPGACIADLTLTVDQLKAVRVASDAGRLVFKDAAGRDVVLPISFRGLAQALDALSKA